MTAEIALATPQIAGQDPLFEVDLTADELRARRKQHIVERRRAGASFNEIGTELGISGEWSRKLYREALADIPAESVQHYRQEQIERLDRLLAEANAVLARRHVTVSNGKVVTLKQKTRNAGGEEVETETVIEDDGPTLDAIRTILQIEKLRAELLGTPAPQRIEALAVVRYEIVGVNLDALR